MGGQGERRGLEGPEGLEAVKALLSSTVAVLLGIVVVHSCSLHGQEVGCREAGGTSTRHAFSVTCEPPITITPTTRDRLDALLEFTHVWLTSIAQTPDDGTPERARGLASAKKNAEEAASLRRELGR